MNRDIKLGLIAVLLATLLHILIYLILPFDIKFGILSIIISSYFCLKILHLIFPDFGTSLTIEEHFKSILGWFLSILSIIFSICIIYYSSGKMTIKAEIFKENKQVKQNTISNPEKSVSKTNTTKTSDTSSRDSVVIDIYGVVYDLWEYSPLNDVEIIIGNDTTKSVSSGEFVLKNKKTFLGENIIIQKKGYFDWNGFIEKKCDTIYVFLKSKMRIVLGGFELNTNEQNTQIESLLSEILKSSFVGCNEIEVLSRDADLSSILEEIEYEKKLETIFDPKEITKTGKMLGANYIVTGKINETDKNLNINVNLNDMKYGKIVYNKRLNVNRDDDLEIVLNKYSNEIVAKISKVKILNIEKNINQINSYSIEGINSCLPSGWSVWISVLPAGSDKIHPQIRASVTNNKWVAPSIFLGEENSTKDCGRSFYIQAILASPKTDSTFSSYLSECKKIGEFPGIEIPKASIGYHQVNYRHICE